MYPIDPNIITYIFDVCRWPFMTTHTWGEDPRGIWTLSVGFKGDYPQIGKFDLHLL